jgi:hypothetical protein
MAQTAMYTPNPSTRGSIVAGGHTYEVRDQIVTVDNDHVPALRSLGFMTAVEANVKAAEVTSVAAAQVALEQAQSALASAQAAQAAIAAATAPAKTDAPAAKLSK